MTTIKPDYLAHLRRKYQVQLVMTLVQLEQVAPCWHQNVDMLAEELGIEITCLRRAVKVLEREGLIKRYSSPNTGTWIWWVKNSEQAQPPPPPGWILKEVATRKREKIEIGKERQWAAKRSIKYNTLKSFLYGYRKTLDSRWILLETPMDFEVQLSKITTHQPTTGQSK